MQASTQVELAPSDDKWVNRDCHCCCDSGFSKLGHLRVNFVNSELGDEGQGI